MVPNHISDAKITVNIMCCVRRKIKHFLAFGIYRSLSVPCQYRFTEQVSNYPTVRYIPFAISTLSVPIYRTSLKLPNSSVYTVRYQYLVSTDLQNKSQTTEQFGIYRSLSVPCQYRFTEQEGRMEMFYFTTHSTQFILLLYGVGHMVKDHSDSEGGNPLPPHRLLFPINSKGSFICTIPETG